MTLEEMTNRQAFDMYFSALMSMNNHPGTTQGRAQKLSTSDVAKIADEMMQERAKRIEQGLI